MMVININLEWEKRWVWNTPMLCQHADRLWFSILPTVWIIIKSQTYGRRVTECHLSCLHREEELVLKERHGNVFLKSFLVSEGKLIRQCRRRVLVNYWSRETSVVWKKPFFFKRNYYLTTRQVTPPPMRAARPIRPLPPDPLGLETPTDPSGVGSGPDWKNQT